MTLTDKTLTQAYAAPDTIQLLERGLLSLAAIPHGGIDVMRLIRVASGVLCELSLDAIEDPAELWQSEIEKLWDDVGLDAAERESIIESYNPSLYDPSKTDREMESGRLLIRSIQMTHGTASEVFVPALRGFLAQIVLSAGKTKIERAELMLHVEIATRDSLSYEIATQELCDLLIETKIAQHAWSLGDAICALAGAAAQRLAIRRAAMNWRWEDSYQTIADVMMREAVSLGVPAATGWEFGMAANDCRPNPPAALIQAVETSCIVFLDLIAITDFETQAVVLAKSAGRMLALAATGDRPELEAHIAKPLACHAVAETLRSFV